MKSLDCVELVRRFLVSILLANPAARGLRYWVSRCAGASGVCEFSHVVTLHSRRQWRAAAKFTAARTKDNASYGPARSTRARY